MAINSLARNHATFANRTNRWYNINEIDEQPDWTSLSQINQMFNTAKTELRQSHITALNLGNNLDIITTFRQLGHVCGLERSLRLRYTNPAMALQMSNARAMSMSSGNGVFSSIISHST